MRFGFAFSFRHTNDCGLIVELTFVASTLTANVGFVHLNNAAELVGVLLHQLAYLLTDAVGTLIGHAKVAL